MDHNQQQQDADREAQEKLTEGEGAVSAVALAVAHWQSVLLDEKASDTAKANAANGLARFGQAEMERNAGRLHQLTRAELQSEITRVRTELAG